MLLFIENDDILHNTKKYTEYTVYQVQYKKNHYKRYKGFSIDSEILSSLKDLKYRGKKGQGTGTIWEA